MRKEKKRSVFLVLFLMTVCIVFFPRLISEQNEGNLLNKKIYWNCNTSNNAKITSYQIVELYYNREISIYPYKFVPLEEGEYDVTLMRENLLAMFETVFGSSEPLYEYMKAILVNGSLEYAQSSTLTKVDNQPLALNFIDVTVKNEDSILEFTYEEKTKTIICFLYRTSYPYFDPDYEYEEKLLGDSLGLAVEDYYERQIGSNQSKYYFLNESVEKTEMKGCCLKFGILQCPINEEGKLDE